MKNLKTDLCHFSFRQLMVLPFILFSLQIAEAQYELVTQDYNTSTSIAPRAIGMDADGNIFICGRFQTLITLGSITLDNSMSSGQTGFIAKYSPATGTWLWAKQITNVSILNFLVQNALEDLDVDAQGNVYVTGYFMGSILVDNIPLTSTKTGKLYTSDILVVKISPSGSVVWAKAIGTKSGGDYANAIKVDASNNVYIGGTFGNTSNCFYTYDQKNEIYLAKLNNLGVVQWQKRYVASNATCQNVCTVYNLALDAAGSILMTGAYQGNVSFGTGSGMTISSVANSVDPFTAKVSNNGTTQWVRAIASTSSYEAGNAVCVDAAGNSYSGGEFDPVGFSNKYTTSGNLSWSLDPFQAPVSELLTLDGGSIMAAHSRIGIKIINSTDGSVTDSDSLVGNSFNQNPFTGSFFIHDVALSQTGFVFLAVGRCGTVTIDDLELTCENTCDQPFATDIIIVQSTSLPFYARPDRVTQAVNNDELVKNSLDFNIYPNPVQDEVNVGFGSVISSARLIIHDQFGKEIWSRDAEEMISMSLPLDEHRFSPGVYYFTTISNGEVQTKRFIVTK